MITMIIQLNQEHYLVEMEAVPRIGDMITLDQKVWLVYNVNWPLVAVGDGQVKCPGPTVLCTLNEAYIV